MQLRTISFDFVFDSREVGQASSVTALVDRMEEFASGAQHVSSSGPVEYSPPPTVRLVGEGLRHVEVPWVISELEWGRSTLDGAGRVVRQLGTVTLLQRLEGPSFSRVDTNNRARRSRIVYSRKGENLRMVARRTMKDPKLWRLLKPVNTKLKFRDPLKVLATRTAIRVPIK